MKVVILCGGRGTRLNEETEHLPKPMVQLGGLPIVGHIMRYYRHYGFHDFVLCTGYKHEIVESYFSQPHSWLAGAKVILCRAGLDATTGERLIRAAHHLDRAQFCLTYGDGLADVPLLDVYDEHQLYRAAANSSAIVTLTAVKPLSRFGVLDLDAGGVVHGFIEKPRSQDWINAGFMVMDYDIVHSIDPTKSLENSLAKLAADGRLRAYRHEGFFFAMDTYREYQALNEMWDRGEAPWRKWDV